MPPSDLEKFRDLVRRVREGDPAAAEEIFRLYEPEIRREVRLRLKGPEIRRLLDSVDICQSVLHVFFVRAARGEFELDHPSQLRKLFVTMAQNRIIDWSRRLRARRRDIYRENRLEGMEERPEMADPRDPTPSVAVAADELLEEFRKRLTDGERRIADLRARGLTWPEVAAEMGEDRSALRKRLERARARVIKELGLGEEPP